MPRTDSELLFEAFCQVHGIACSRIAENVQSRPDYELVINGREVLVEVKQFDANAEEQAAAVRESRGEQVVLGTTPGQRVRCAIREANRQLKTLLANRSLPTLLVLYNNTTCRLHTEPYSVMTAMQGLDVIDITVPSDPNQPPQWGAVRSGQGRAMREDVNTSTSAVAVMTDVALGVLELTVYHNRFAACPLDPDLIRLLGVRHLRLPTGGQQQRGSEVGRGLTRS